MAVKPAVVKNARGNGKMTSDIRAVNGSDAGRGMVLNGKKHDVFIYLHNNDNY